MTRVILRTIEAILATSLIIGVTSDKKYRDYDYNRKTDAFYKLHTEEKTFRRAQEWCQFEGASLMVPTTEDISQLHGMLKKYPDIGNYVYVGNDGLNHESAEEAAIVNLSEESNENESLGRDCEVVTRRGDIDSTWCYHSHPFICKVSAEKIPYDERCGVYSTGYKYYDNVKTCYYVPPKPLTWNGACDECEKEGAHLIVIRSAAERDTVKEFLKTVPRHADAHTTYFFFAGIRANRPRSTRVFKTIFNETLEEAGFSEWSDGEPNNHMDTEYCGSVFSNNGKYNDVDCLHFYSFICQKPVAT